jgi:hypothetical protein
MADRFGDGQPTRERTPLFVGSARQIPQSRAFYRAAYRSPGRSGFTSGPVAAPAAFPGAGLLFLDSSDAFPPGH